MRAARASSVCPSARGVHVCLCVPLMGHRWSSLFDGLPMTLYGASLAGAGNPSHFVLNNGPGMAGGLYEQV